MNLVRAIRGERKEVQNPSSELERKEQSKADKKTTTVAKQIIQSPTLVAQFSVFKQSSEERITESSSSILFEIIKHAQIVTDRENIIYLLIPVETLNYPPFKFIIRSPEGRTETCFTIQLSENSDELKRLDQIPFEIGRLAPAHPNDPNSNPKYHFIKNADIFDPRASPDESSANK